MKKLFAIILMGLAVSFNTQAQKKVKLVVDPDPIEVEVGKTLALKVKGVDGDGNQLEDTKLYFFATQLQGVEQNMIFTAGITVDTTGVITAKQTGVFDIFVSRVPAEGEGYASEFFKVTVLNQPLASLELNVPNKLYEGTFSTLEVNISDEGGFDVNDAVISYTSSNPEILVVDRNGNIKAKQKGKATITATADNVETSLDLEVLANPVRNLELQGSLDFARTGDVVKFKTMAYDKSGKEITDVPVSFSVSGQSSDLGSGSSAMIDQEGRFVAEKPGIYTVTVSSGNMIANASVDITERNLSRKIVMKGQGSVSDQHTSDFWVWEGVDGKDYAVTGTWGSDGKAYFWEVTNPSDIKLIDSVQVDARTVNDVKVSEDGKICVISREGASNRKNGIVILDVTNPADVQELSTFTENLTGGVHNVFIYKDYVYALSNGQWYEIISIKDPKNPVGVSKFELSNSAKSIHDVWIEDGIAYSSNWSDGIAMVDIGNGVAGGTPENPVEISRGHVQGDANHAAFPYKSKDTGKFYVIAGDEIFPLEAMSSAGLDKVIIPSGYLHFMDMTDPDNPKEVARYEVPEAGSHNFWIEDDILYIGYYNGGLRVVDLSGDLMGDLYKQGREIAYYVPYDKNGYVPNSPFVWGAQPYKGHIFFSDFNSGLWSVQLEPVKPEETTVEAR